ncbi:MAG: hypothetical protein WCE79_10525 [Xanthobacteraceae bacterium]
MTPRLSYRNTPDRSGIPVVVYAEFTSSLSLDTRTVTGRAATEAKLKSFVFGRSDVPRRRQSPPKAAVDAGPPPKRRAAAVLARRTRLMLQIAALQRAGLGSRLTANAEQLLTRWWAAANWSARDDLLKTADWLLRADTLRDGNKPSRA